MTHARFARPRHVLLAGCLLAGCLLAGGAPARAGQAPAAIDILVCYPGGSVRARDAQPALQDMVKVIESIGGWPAGTINTSFTTRDAECRQLLEEKKPPFAILSLGIFLQARRAHHLVSLVQPRIGGKSEDRFYLMVRRNTFGKLADLAGKTLGGPWLGDLEFLKRVVFQRQIDPASHFRLKPSRRVLRALRQLDRGRLDAVLVNRPQFEGLAALPFGKNLQSIYTSASLPQMGIAADEKRSSARDRQKMLRALRGMCTHQDGKKLCELFGIDSFDLPDGKLFDSVIKAWESKP